MNEHLSIILQGSNYSLSQFSKEHIASLAQRISSRQDKKGKEIEYESQIVSLKHTTLQDAANFLIGPFGSAYDTSNYVPESNYRYVRGQDVKPFI